MQPATGNAQELSAGERDTQYVEKDSGFEPHARDSSVGRRLRLERLDRGLQKIGRPYFNLAT